MTYSEQEKNLRWFMEEWLRVTHVFTNGRQWALLVHLALYAQNSTMTTQEIFTARGLGGGSPRHVAGRCKTLERAGLLIRWRRANKQAYLKFSVCYTLTNKGRQFLGLRQIEGADVERMKGVIYDA